jgi:hypothetical protein
LTSVSPLIREKEYCTMMHFFAENANLSCAIVSVGVKVFTRL